MDLTNKINNRGWRDSTELRASTALAGYLKCIPRTQVGEEARPSSVSGKGIHADGLTSRADKETHDEGKGWAHSLSKGYQVWFGMESPG